MAASKGLISLGCTGAASAGQRCALCSVRHIALCAALDAEELRDLEQIVTHRHVEANAVIVQEGDAVDQVFSVTDGMLRLSVSFEDGRRQIADFAMPGSLLGLAEDDVHSLTIEAVTASDLCVFPVAGIRRLFVRHPKLKDRLLEFGRADLRAARRLQLSLGRNTPAEKVADFLLRMEQRELQCAPRGAGPRQGMVVLPMTRTDIADHLGLTIETVSRTFTRLRKDGVIRLPEPHLVELVDRARLAELAHQV